MRFLIALKWLAIIAWTALAMLLAFPFFMMAFSYRHHTTQVFLRGVLESQQRHMQADFSRARGRR